MRRPNTWTYLHPSWQQPKLPLTFTLVVFLVLQQWPVPMVWLGVIYAILVMVWITIIVMIHNAKHVDLDGTPYQKPPG